MADKKYFIDDRIIIPDEIKNMTNEEIDAEIERLESEIVIVKNEKIKRTQRETA
jgi:hypothetical protein